MDDSPTTRRWMTPAEKETHEKRLIANVHARLAELEKMLEAVNGKWACEDLVYRFYHQSFKVYMIQEHTTTIVTLLQSLLPELPLNTWFQDIVRAGTGKKFEDKDNSHWREVTRPMLEAFFHARYFLEMICKYGKQLTEPPTTIPSGWAGVLYLYNIR